MASLDKYSSISKQLSDLVTNYSKERDKKVAETKAKYGYDDRISSLENLKKTSLDTERVIRALPTDIDNRLAGRRMTAGQRNRVFAREQAPLARQLADISMGVRGEQEGIDLVRSLINDVLGTAREDFNINYGLLDRELGTAWDEYKTNIGLEEGQRQRDWQSRENQMNRYSHERASTANYDIFKKLIEDEKRKMQGGSPAQIAQKTVEDILKRMKKTTSGTTPVNTIQSFRSLPGLKFLN